MLCCRWCTTPPMESGTPTDVPNPLPNPSPCWPWCMAMAGGSKVHWPLGAKSSFRGLGEVRSQSPGMLCNRCCRWRCNSSFLKHWILSWFSETSQYKSQFPIFGCSLQLLPFWSRQKRTVVRLSDEKCLNGLLHDTLEMGLVLLTTCIYERPQCCQISCSPNVWVELWVEFESWVWDVSFELRDDLLGLSFWVEFEVVLFLDLLSWSLVELLNWVLIWVELLGLSSEFSFELSCWIELWVWVLSWIKSWVDQLPSKVKAALFSSEHRNTNKWKDCELSLKRFHSLFASTKCSYQPQLKRRRISERNDMFCSKHSQKVQFAPIPLGFVWFRLKSSINLQLNSQLKLRHKNFPSFQDAFVTCGRKWNWLQRTEHRRPVFFQA